MIASTSCSAHGASRKRAATHPPAAGAAVTAARPRQVAARAAATAVKSQPFWTGEELVSRAVNALIHSPLYAPMKFLARAAMKQTAARCGVDWDAEAGRMMADPELHRLKNEIEQPGLKYPDYYLVPMHSYADGNLNWLAAAEMRPASAVIACRVFPEMTDAAAAVLRFRTTITSTIRQYLQRRGLGEPKSILDAGCSTGIGTRWLAREFPEAAITGIDASPYFLAVAELEQRRDPLPGGRRVRFDHALAEAAPYPDCSFDLVAFQYVAHECPQAAIRSFISEARRLLRPGGVVVFVDNNPRSPRLQSMPPAMFTLMKSSEPWSDEFYSLELESALVKGGFRAIWTMPVNTSHHAVFGQLPPEAA